MVLASAGLILFPEVPPGRICILLTYEYLPALLLLITLAITGIISIPVLAKDQLYQEAKPVSEIGVGIGTGKSINQTFKDLINDLVAGGILSKDLAYDLLMLTGEKRARAETILGYMMKTHGRKDISKEARERIVDALREELREILH